MNSPVQLELLAFAFFFLGFGMVIVEGCLESNMVFLKSELFYESESLVPANLFAVLFGKHVF